MLRRALTILLVLSLASFGYQPQAGAGVPADQAAASASTERPAVEPSAMPDCPDAKAAGNCCDQTDGQKQTCNWDSACAARCHVMIGIEPMTCAPRVAVSPVGLVTVREPQSPVLERPWPLFRPPIL